MRAAQWWGKSDIRVRDIPEPRDPSDGEVLLRMLACGICGTDVEEYTHGPAIIPVQPHPLSGRCAPLTMGHEAVGVVEEAGPSSTLTVGTRVAVEGNFFCGKCWWCERREFQLCEQLACMGLMADGGLAEFMVAPEFMCIPFSDHVPSERASLAEPLSVAVRAARRGGVGQGSSVGVIGCGTVGLLSIQAARIAGAQTVIAVDRLAERRDLALKLGADVAVEPEMAEQAMYDVNAGVGPDVTIEAAGNPNAVAAAIKLVRRGGRAVLLGVFNQQIHIDMFDLLLAEKSIIASLSHVYDLDYTTAVDLINTDAVQIDPLITDRIELDDVVERGFRPLIDEPEAHLKIVVMPSGVSGVK